MAQAALDQRNTRFRGSGLRSMMEDDGGGGDDGAIWDRQRNAAMERLEQAEKVAERIVSKRIPQAVQKVRTILTPALAYGTEAPHPNASRSTGTRFWSGDGYPPSALDSHPDDRRSSWY